MKSMKNTGINQLIINILTFKASVIVFTLAFLLLQGFVAHSQNDTVINREVMEIVVKAEKKHNISINSSGRISLSNSGFNNIPRVLGESDPLKYVLMLPGAGTSSDYASGISVQGCDYSQTLIQLDEAPIFFPYHLFGIFSVCNSTHFSDVAFEKSIHSVDFQNRLGGLIDLQPKTKYVRKLNGDINLGLLASSLTFAIPCGKKLSIYASSRISYISLFYSSLLKTSDGETSYDFQDYNLTAVYRFNYYNKLTFNWFYDNDDFEVNETESLNLNLAWKNYVSTLSFSHEGNLNYKITGYYSGFNSQLKLSMADNNILVPSKISVVGVKFNSSYPLLQDKSELKSGGEFLYYNLKPQGVESDFGGNVNPDTDDYECDVFTQANYRFTENIEAIVGARYSGFSTQSTYFQGLSPLFTLNFNALGCHFSLHHSIYRQYLHQIGFSDVGLSTNSWIEVSEKLKPQTSYTFSFSCLKSFCDNKYALQSEIYYKKVNNQSEFFGNIFDLFSTEYKAENYIETGKGYNTGLDLLLEKSEGKIFGSVGYAFGLSQRKFEKYADEYLPSSNEILHTIKTNLNCKIGNNWLLSAVFNYSSGRPVTPIKYVYMISEKLIAEYGKHNSSRLDDYHRLDISASYRFHSGKNNRLYNSINVSVTNVYGKQNTEFRYYKLDVEKNKILYREKTSVFRFLPSLSYSLHF